ncbi:MAG TPA: hypothetical protein VFN30_15270 [Chitinophagaceae bacterium]|nr:hypothetical protein [Chitinophagaceae bacterium]
MKPSFVKYIYEYFEKLIERFGLKKQNEQGDGQSYSVEYSSDIFVVRLEKYRREFYATLYKIGHSDDEINLFNLLQYLNKDATPKAPEAKYFPEESNIDECYRKQLRYITDVVCENFTELNDFFREGNYESKVKDIKRFMMEKYPELYKRT